MEQREGINILICGSSHNGDMETVFQTLNKAFELYQGRLTTITTSNYEGSCALAELWAITKNETLPKNQQIKIKKFNYSGFSDHKNKPIYEDLDIPQDIRKNHDFYVKGSEELISHGVNLVFAYPNEEGQLGISTKNVIMFAEDAGIRSVNVAEWLDLLKEKNELEEKKEVKETIASKFKHAHPLKR